MQRQLQRNRRATEIVLSFVLLFVDDFVTNCKVDNLYLRHSLPMLLMIFS